MASPNVIFDILAFVVSLIVYRHRIPVSALACQTNLKAKNSFPKHQYGRFVWKQAYFVNCVKGFLETVSQFMVQGDMNYVVDRIQFS